MSEKFDAGDVVHLTAALTVAGVATDPATLSLKVDQPDGTTTTYTWGAGQVVRDSAGHFHFDLDLTSAAAGVWRWRWFSTGAAQAAGEGDFEVRRSVF